MPEFMILIILAALVVSILGIGYILSYVKKNPMLFDHSIAIAGGIWFVYLLSVAYIR